MKNFCSGCGGSLRLTSRFCPSCGKPLEEPLQPAVSDIPTTLAEPRSQPAPVPKTTEPSPPLSKPVVLGIGLSAVAAVALLIAAGNVMRSGTPVDSGDPRIAERRIKGAALAAITWSNDHGGMYPEVASTAEAVSAFRAYASGNDAFDSPAGGSFLYNLDLSGVDSTALPQPSATPMWIEPGEKAEVLVAYADGHAARVPRESVRGRF